MYLDEEWFHKIMYSTEAKECVKRWQI
jgi:hypothetical protein